MPPPLPNTSIDQFGRGGLVEKFINFLNGIPDYFHTLSQSHSFLSLVYFLWALFVIIFGYAIYIVVLTMKQQDREKRAYFAHFASKQESQNSIIQKGLSRWEEIMEHMRSESESDWKIAILEADSLLGEMLEKLGYQGDNLGERLKGVPKGEMLNLDSAWAAHKLRNRIAHEGASLKITREDLSGAMKNFENVFREFNYI